MIDMRTEMIGPGRAKELLEKNGTNRNISIGTVKAYAKMMRNGDWDFTPQGITISKTGNLIDGQHRLSAIIMADVTIPVCVFITSEHENAMGVMLDRGKIRSATDVTGIGKDIVSMANFILRHVLSVDGGPSSPTDTKRFCEEHSKAISWYETNVPKTHVRTLSEASIRSALLIRYMAGENWLDQYMALNRLDFNGMNNGTQILYRYTIKRNMYRKDVFSLAYKVSSSEGRKLTRIPSVITIGDAKDVIIRDVSK